MIPKLFIYYQFVVAFIVYGQQGQGQGQQFNPQSPQGQPQGQFIPQQGSPTQFGPVSNQVGGLPGPQQSSGQQFGNPNQPVQQGQGQLFPGQPQNAGQGQFQPNQPPNAGQQPPPFNGGQQQNFGGSPQQPQSFGNPQQQNSNPVLLGQGQQPMIPGGNNNFGGNPNSNPGGAGNVAGAPQVKITPDLMSVDRAPAVQQLLWQEPMMSQIYCVSQPPAQELRFTCPTCNVNGTSQQYFDQILQQHTQNLADLAGYPAIKLAQMPINGEIFDRQTLRCEAYYSGGTGRLNASVDATIAVMYMGKPRIVLADVASQSYRNPVMGPDGNRFYVSQQGFQLTCLASGNPQPQAYQWLVNGIVYGSNAQQQFTSQQANQAVTCRATNVQPQQGQQVSTNMWKESSVVLLGQLMGPGVAQTNFDEVKKTMANDIVNGKIALGKSTQLSCVVAGSPKPYITWFQQSGQGHVINATCNGGSRIVAEDPPTNPNHAGYWYVTGQCSLNFDTLERSGDYWCSACVFVAENSSVCVPTGTQVPQQPQSINFDLSGPPKISDSFRIERTPNSERVVLYFTYCADPPPNSNEVYWTVGNERLNLNNRIGNNIQAGASQQNTSFTDCFDVPLTFENAAAMSYANNYQLNIEPAGGQKIQRSFQVGELLAVNNGNRTNSMAAYSTAFDPTGLAVGIAVGLFLLVLIIICAYLWYRRLACFAPKKSTTTTTTSKTKPKPGTKYQSNLAPAPVRSEALPEKMPPLTRPNPDGYPAERSNVHHSTNGYSPSNRRTHEGLTYSEFDLVKDSNRPPPPGSRPVEYTRLHTTAPTNLKSPTNSTV